MNIKKTNISISEIELTNYVKKQLNFFFPENKRLSSYINILVKNALSRSIFCFTNVNQKHFSDEKNVFFNHLNGDQYSTFLYFLSNEAYKNGEYEIYVKSSQLNKALHGIDIFGHVNMPDIFLLVHPLGSIIGRATLNNYLVIYQNVTIGGKHNENGTIEYPKLGYGTVVYSGASIIGKVSLSKDITIGANTFISNFKLDEPNMMVLGSYPNNIIKPISNRIDYFYR